MVAPRRRLSPEEIWRLGGSLRDWLGLCPPFEPKAGDRPARRLQVSIREVRRFLECPLQGWARLMLRLREDDDGGEAERDDEPFATARFQETILLRDVFLDMLRAPPRALLVRLRWRPCIPPGLRSGRGPV